MTKKYSNDFLVLVPSLNEKINQHHVVDIVMLIHFQFCVVSRYKIDHEKHDANKKGNLSYIYNFVRRFRHKCKQMVKTVSKAYLF